MSLGCCIYRRNGADDHLQMARLMGKGHCSYGKRCTRIFCHLGTVKLRLVGSTVASVVGSKSAALLPIVYYLSCTICNDLLLKFIIFIHKGL